MAKTAVASRATTVQSFLAPWRRPTWINRWHSRGSAAQEWDWPLATWQPIKIWQFAVSECYATNKKKDLLLADIWQIIGPPFCFEKWLLLFYNKCECIQKPCFYPILFSDKVSRTWNGPTISEFQPSNLPRSTSVTCRTALSSSKTTTRQPLKTRGSGSCMRWIVRDFIFFYEKEVIMSSVVHVLVLLQFQINKFEHERKR